MFRTDFEIIDFHTHPFLTKESNICAHQDVCDMDANYTLAVMDELNVSHFCGSVIRVGVPKTKEDALEKMRRNNEEALALRARYNGRYIPGFHVNPNFPRESCEEIERMKKLGVNIIGELVPYMDGWSDYASPAFSEILDVAEQYQMIVSFHSMGEDAMDEMVRSHKNITFVAAHPGEYGELTRHIARAKLSDNYCIDLSGYGIFRHGALRKLLDTVGVDRILFGSDYPTCNAGMYVGGVMLDRTVTDGEREKIFSLNAKRLLKL